MPKFGRQLRVERPPGPLSAERLRDVHRNDRPTLVQSEVEHHTAANSCSLGLSVVRCWRELVQSRGDHRGRSLCTPGRRTTTRVEGFPLRSPAIHERADGPGHPQSALRPAWSKRSGSARPTRRAGHAAASAVNSNVATMPGNKSTQGMMSCWLMPPKKLT